MSRFEQIVANLVGNALKYTPDGGRVTVRLATEGDRAVLEVADTGRGIAPELMPRIFDLFVQGDRDIARAEGGSGIGLAVVGRLVDALGGQVEAHSAGPGPAPGPATASRPYRVLVIEDNDAVREMLVAWLVSLTGYGGLSADRSVQAGFDLHLTKPLTAAHLELLFGRPVA